MHVRSRMAWFVCMSLVECGIQPRGRYDAKRSMPSGKHPGYDKALGTCCEKSVRAILDFGFMFLTGRESGTLSSAIKHAVRLALSSFCIDQYLFCYLIVAMTLIK